MVRTVPGHRDIEVTLKWYTAAIDRQDLHAQARWWADVLDWQLVYEDADQAVARYWHDDLGDLMIPGR